MADQQQTLFPYPGATKSRAWTYFAFQKKPGVEGPPIKANLDMSTAICRLCGKSYVFKGNTTNFNFHLSHFHNDQISPGPGSSTATDDKLQSRISTHFAPPNTVPQKLMAGKQQEIDEALLKLMAGKVLPLSLVENQYFRKFVSLLNPMYSIPGRKAISSRLEDKKDAIEKIIKKELSGVEDIAITHDGWTSANTESYSTVTAHFINTSWELKSVVLEKKKVEGSHTGENIKDCLLETQEKWKLPNPTGVTDNASNEQKAFRLLNWTRFGCYGHGINLVVKNALAIPELSKIIAKGRKLVTFFHQSTSVNDLLMEKQRLLNTESIFRNHKLIMDVVTRWNSTHDMLQRLLEQTPAIMGVATDTRLSQKAGAVLKANVYSFEDTSIVEALVKALNPFLKATLSLCADKSPTLHKVIPIVRKLLKESTESEGDGPCIKKVKQKMKSELLSRTKDSDIALMACVLNPYTKGLEFLEPEEKATAHQHLQAAAMSLKVTVKQEPDDSAVSASGQSTSLPLPTLPQAPKEMKVTEISTSEVDNQTDQCVPVKKRKLVDMDDWFDDVVCVGSSHIPISDVITAEVARYISMQVPEGQNMSIFDWWKEYQNFYPHIAMLAKKYLAIPASSVPSERVFSLAGQVVSNKRSRLRPSMVNTLIFLNKNIEYWS